MARVGTWYPMNTARRDGVAVLLWWPHWWHDPHPGYFKDNKWHSDKALYGGGVDDENGPEAWSPLPKPPLSSKEG